MVGPTAKSPSLRAGSETWQGQSWDSRAPGNSKRVVYVVPRFIITMTYLSCTRPAADGTLLLAADLLWCRDGAPSSLRLPATSGRPSKRGRASIRLRIETSFARRSSSWPPPVSEMMSSARVSTFPAKSSASGGSASSTNAWWAWTKTHEAGSEPAFPPSVVVEVKRLACEAPRVHGVPLARWSLRELQRQIVTRGVVAMISGTTVWRWLAADAIRPWRYRSWLFPRDPNFAATAGPILDLYSGIWEGQPLAPDDCIPSADEKTSIQARRRRHAWDDRSR
jgi:hypothetical protein